MFAIFLSEGMNPFYQNVGSFPTVIYTFFLIIFVLYWLVAVLGLIEIDALDFDIPTAEADLDLNLSNSADSSVDAGNNSDVSDASALVGLLLRFGLYGIPITIILSLVTLFGWLICYYTVHLSFDYIPEGGLQYVAGLPVFFVTLYLSAKLTAVVIKPLRPFFKQTEQNTSTAIIGQTAVVRTSRVDDGFGEAVLADGGAGLILKVRAMDQNVFHKGDHIVLLEYLEQEGIYKVISEAEFAKHLS